MKKKYPQSLVESMAEREMVADKQSEKEVG